MKVEFDVKITAGDLYDYMLSHTYSGFSGLFGSIVGALFIVYYAATRTNLYFLIAGILILLYIPWSEQTIYKYYGRMNMDVLSKTMPFLNRTIFYGI